MRYTRHTRSELDILKVENQGFCAAIGGASEQVNPYEKCELEKMQIWAQGWSHGIDSLARTFCE